MFDRGAKSNNAKNFHAFNTWNLNNFGRFPKSCSRISAKRIFGIEHCLQTCPTTTIFIIELRFVVEHSLLSGRTTDVHQMAIAHQQLKPEISFPNNLHWREIRSISSFFLLKATFSRPFQRNIPSSPWLLSWAQQKIWRVLSQESRCYFSWS